MNKYMRLTISLTLCALLALPLGCSKKESSSSQASPAANVLLSRIPKDAQGYITIDTSSEQYENYLKTPWSGDVSLFSEDSAALLEDGTIPGTSASGAQSMIKIFKSIMGSKAATDIPKGPGVAFVKFSSESNGKAAKIEAGAIFERKKGGPINALLETTKTELKNEQIALQDEEIDGRKGFSLSTPPPPADSPITSSGKLFIVADDSLLAAGTTREMVSALLKPGAADSVPTLNFSPYFAKTTQALGQRNGEMLFGIIDVAALIDRMSGLSSGAEFKPSDIPVQAFAFSRSFVSTPQDAMALSLEAKNDEQKKLINVVENSPATALASNAPSGAVFHLQLDAGTIKNVLKIATEKGSAPPLPPEVQTQIDSIKRLGITVKNAEGASLFPALLISAQSTQAESLKNSLKAMLGALGAAQGLPVAGWQEKSVENVPVSFMQTPIGVGVYVASTSDLLTIASSEEALKGSLLAPKTASASLAGSLPSDFIDLMTGANSVGLTFIDFGAAAKLIESSAGTLSMFTGGQPPMEAQKITDLKKLGRMLYVLKLEPGVLTISSRTRESLDG